MSPFVGHIQRISSAWPRSGPVNLTGPFKARIPMKQEFRRVATGEVKRRYGREKKLKIQHFCARKLLETLDRFFAKAIFPHDLRDPSISLNGVPALKGRPKFKR